jgi:hypothetical protein
MKNGKCPKCGSATIYTKPGGLGFGNISQVFIYLKSGYPASTKAYICTTCGYYEVYVTATSVLAEVAQSWQKVTPK